MSLGTITVTPYSNQIIGDAVSSAAWQAYIANNSRPFFTELQIRNPAYSLYSIIAIDNGTTNPPFTTITIDRPWMEPGGAAQAYMIYQAYFPAPVSDFHRFLWARDTTNSNAIDYWSLTQRDLAVLDPERSIFDNPVYIVPYQVDQRPNSATLGNMLYEFWPGPVSILPYTFGYLRRGQTLINPGDTVPYPMTEDCVIWQAKTEAFLWKESQKGDEIERGAGADNKFLSQSAQAKYLLKLAKIEDRDRDLVDLYFNRYMPDLLNGGQPFSNETGGLNIGYMVNS